VNAFTLPLRQRTLIADAPPEKQPDIAKAVVEKKLTEKETKKLVEAVIFPLVTEEDRDAMLYDPITRPYLRDQKGEKIQSLDSAMREMDTTNLNWNGTLYWRGARNNLRRFLRVVGRLT
jgi:ParB-like chromosome segregation protein Spo0J